MYPTESILEITSKDFDPPEDHHEEAHVSTDTAPKLGGAVEAQLPRPLAVEYPDWMDDIPPWRNPKGTGSVYLYVWQQHESRMRGHH